MRIFLTGGTGFIGSHYLDRMSGTPHRVTAVRRPGTLARAQALHQAEWLEKPLDALDESDMAGHDTLVHLASAGVSPKPATWQDLLYWNVSVSTRILETAHRAGIRRFVIAGSSAEYGQSANEYEFIPVEAALRPVSAYAASKAAACILATTFAGVSQVELVYLRIFSAYGERQYEQNFWPSLKAAALAGQDFPMTPGEQVRDFIRVEDVAEAIAHATERTDVVPGVPRLVNVGSGIPVSMREFAQRCWAEWGARGRLLPGALAYRPNEPMRFVPKIS